MLRSEKRLHRIQRGFILLKYFPIITLVILLLGCDITESDPPGGLIDSRIDFKFVESYSGHDTISIPEIFVRMETEKIYPHCNYDIELSWQVNGNNIEIDLIGIHIPPIGFTMSGPARGVINLGRISGEFNVTFRERKFENEYELIISDSLITVDGIETDHTKPIFTSIFRYPENSFVYFSGTTLTDTFICADFIDTLKSVIDIIEFSFSDIAEIPYLTSNQGHQYNAPVRYFFYESENDFEKIEEVMRAYKLDHFPIENVGVHLSITNWMNRKVRSWLL